MSNDTVGPKVLKKVFFVALLLVFSLTACGGASISGTASGLSVTLATARTSGVAPLAVFFDATNTTDNAVTARPFHDLQFTWNFGDTAGTLVPGSGGIFGWNTGAGSGGAASCTAKSDTSGCRNFATGGVAAHVYEVPGTYTATLTVFDGTNTVTKNTTITVTDPEVIFSGKTACVANGITPVPGSGGCPTVATLLYNSSVFDTTLAAAISAGASRILFRRGDSFTSSSTTTLTTTSGPGLLGAYGTSASPSITSTAMTIYAPLVSVSTADWRVMDLSVSGPTTAVIGVFNQTTTPSQLTALRITTTNMWSSVNITSADQLTVSDSNFSLGTPSTNSGGSDYGIWCAACTNVMLLGNSIALGQSNSHNIRFQGVQKFVVSDSTQIGFTALEPLTVRGNSQYGVISDNKLVNGPTTVKPQNSTANEFQQDLVFERNWFVDNSALGDFLDLESYATTVRNNLFDVSQSPGTIIAVSYVSTVGSPTPSLINIYNNTFYNSTANNGNLSNVKVVAYFSGLPTTCLSSVENNLAYSPNSTGAASQLINNQSNCVITGASGTYGNSSDSQILSTSPSFVSSTPVNPSDFNITSGSYAYHTGVNLPVFSDYFQTVRPRNAISSGAFEGP